MPSTKIHEPRLAAAPVGDMRMTEDRLRNSSNLKSCQTQCAGDTDPHYLKRVTTPARMSAGPPSISPPQKQPVLCGTMLSPTSAMDSTTGISSSNVASRPKSTATSSSHTTPTRHKNLYVGTMLTRPHAYCPWGLSVSLFDRAYLVLGCVNHAVVDKMTTWIRVTAHVPDFVLDDPNNTELKFFATMNKLPLTLTTPQRLLPGDVILSINGRSISSFESLSAVAQYLRQTMHLSIVAWRHEPALQQAHAVWTIQKTNWSIADRAFHAAIAAYGALRHALVNDESSSVSGKSLLQQCHRALYQRTPVAPPLCHNMRAPNTSVASRRSLLPKLHSATEDQLATVNARSSSLVVKNGPSITENFHLWLLYKKKAWKNRKKLLPPQLHTAAQEGKPVTGTSPRALSKFASSSFPHVGPTRWTNPLFRDEHGKRIEYCDNCEFDPADGTRANQFITPVDSQSFPDWLAKRKETWRKTWKVYMLDDDDTDLNENSDFWTPQGYPSFEHWLVESTSKWKRSYSWNQKKRKRIEQDCEEIVHFPSSSGNMCRQTTCDAEAQLQQWLRVRKNQWRIQRRKRQRRREEETTGGDILSINGRKQESLTEDDGQAESSTDSNGEPVQTEPQGSPRSSAAKLKLSTRSTSGDMIHIDALLEEQERRRKALDERPPFDISFIFDARLGAPDDAVAHCLSFLHPSEHGKLLCINSATSHAIKQREHMWRHMCPTHWILPRRPRKPWHELYITKIRREEEASRKRSDDLLTKAAAILFKGGHLHKIEKLVNDGQKRFGFDINYVSGIVCERNSLLNLSVINGRDKIVRWLVEQKEANLESCDRGSFTPLINAAWAGNKYLVRLLLSKGCDRTKIGTGHYTQPLAPPDFKGLNAEGWARKQGHDDIANLIRLGL